MALGTLKSLRIRPEAPARDVAEMPRKPNPTNHMRPTRVGAFILPSVGRVSPYPRSDIQTCTKASQTAMKPDLAHGCGFRRDVVTNRPSDCGASAAQSSVLSVEGWPSCGSDDAGDFVGPLSACAANSE